MLGVTECARQVLATIVPRSLLNDITSFVFYDHHPRGTKRIDVTVCTKNCELKEYFQRDLVFSLDLHCKSPPKEIQIWRNLKSELFYLVSTSNDLFIVSRKEETVVKTISNVEKYYFDDVDCSGQAYLQVIKKDDAVPVSYDENFNIKEDKTVFSETYTEESNPILLELKRKLIEAQYTYKCNEKTLKDYRKLRQLVTLAHCNKLYPNSEDSLFQSGKKNTAGALRVITSPWVKTCNGMLIIAIEVVNEYKKPLQATHILLHNTGNINCITYTTKSFEKCNTPPFWRQIVKLPPNKQSYIVCIIDLIKVKVRATSRIDLSPGICYKVAEEEYLLSLEDIAISSMDCMGDSFDLLSGDQLNQITILAILASTKLTELSFTHVKDDHESTISFLEVFCTYLQMDKIVENIIVYKKSPYHILNGIMIVFNETSESSVKTSVYSRSSSQILALIHTIQDAIPHKITIKNNNSENTHPENLNYKEYASSTLKRSTTILEYLDNSMIKMSESKIPDVLNKIGTEIDLLAAGVEKFKDFKENLEEEARNGVKMLNVGESSEAMVID